MINTCFNQFTPSKQGIIFFFLQNSWHILNFLSQNLAYPVLEYNCHLAVDCKVAYLSNNLLSFIWKENEARDNLSNNRVSGYQKAMTLVLSLPLWVWKNGVGNRHCGSNLTFSIRVQNTFEIKYRDREPSFKSCL